MFRCLRKERENEELKATYIPTMHKYDSSFSVECSGWASSYFRLGVLGEQVSKKKKRN